MINNDITAERLQEIFDEVESGIVLCSSTKGNYIRRLSYDWRARNFVVEFWGISTDNKNYTVHADTIAKAAKAYNKMGPRNV